MRADEKACWALLEVIARGWGGQVPPISFGGRREGALCQLHHPLSALLDHKCSNVSPRLPRPSCRPGWPVPRRRLTLPSFAARPG